MSDYFKDLITIKSLFFALICLLLPIHIYSQQNDLVLNAEELVYSNPDEAIKIANHILNVNQEPQENAIARLILSKSYLVKGDYNKAIIYAFNENIKLNEITIKTRIENNIIKETLLRKLFLDNQSQEYLNKAKLLTSELISEKDKYEYLIFLEQINMFLDRLDLKEANTAIKEAEVQFKNLLKNNPDERRAFYLIKGRVFNGLGQYDSAFVYINKTKDLLDSSPKNSLYEKALIYMESGLLYLQKKELEKSKESLFIALRFAEILDNPFLLEQINRHLAIDYLASNQTNQHKVYYEEFLLLNNTVEQIEQESVNTFYNTISSIEEKKLKTEEQKYINYQKILFAVAIFILIIGILILLKSENSKKRKREIINYLDISRNNFIKIKPSIKPTSKRMVVPEDTERNLLLKLKRFEKSLKFLNKDMSLAVLAGQFETNTKYLSEVINKNYNDNFNTFINKLRINYIIEKLKNDSNYINYKISFLAEESGFSSHSSFATIFKAIIGMSPATFIELLKTEREESNKNNKT
jgi:AraC-like DNA-binding protein